MSLQTYSREYLQSIPEERKQQQIDGIIQNFINDIYTRAGSGKTNYLYDMSNISDRPNNINNGWPSLTLEDRIAGFQKKFPDCKVTYQEIWVATGPNTQVLKKGIVIDWS